MGNIFSRRKSSPSTPLKSLPTSNSPAPIPELQQILCQVHMSLKNLKDRLVRFEPNVSASRDTLKRESKALSSECSKLLSSVSWHPSQEERDVIASLVHDTSHLVEVLEKLAESHKELAAEQISELSAKLEAESADIDALIAAHEIECKKTPAATTGTTQWIELLNKFSSTLRYVGHFLAKNASLEVTFAKDIATGNVVGATVAGIELAASAYSDAVQPSSITAEQHKDSTSTGGAAQPSESHSDKEPSPQCSTASKPESNLETQPETKPNSEIAPVEQSKEAHTGDSKTESGCAAQLPNESSHETSKESLNGVSSEPPTASAEPQQSIANPLEAQSESEAPREVHSSDAVAPAEDQKSAAVEAPVEAPAEAPAVTTDANEKVEVPAEPVKEAASEAPVSPVNDNEQQQQQNEKENAEQLTSWVAVTTQEAKLDGEKVPADASEAHEHQSTQEADGSHSTDASAPAAAEEVKVSIDGDKENNMPEADVSHAEQKAETAQSQSEDAGQTPKTDSQAGEQQPAAAAAEEPTHSQ